MTFMTDDKKINGLTIGHNNLEFINNLRIKFQFRKLIQSNFPVNTNKIIIITNKPSKSFHIKKSFYLVIPQNKIVISKLLISQWSILM